MNKTTLDNLLERVKTWSDQAQAELLASAIDIERRYGGVYRLSEDERAAIEEGLEQVRRGEIVPSEEMDAFWQRHDL